MKSFEIDNRVCVKIDKELASQLSRLILESTTENPALLALGHQLIKDNKQPEQKAT